MDSPQHFALELVCLVPLSLSFPIFDVLLEQSGVEFFLTHVVSILRRAAIFTLFRLLHHLFPCCIIIQLKIHLLGRFSRIRLTQNLDWSQRIFLALLKHCGVQLLGPAFLLGHFQMCVLHRSLVFYYFESLCYDVVELSLLINLMLSLLRLRKRVDRLLYTRSLGLVFVRATDEVN